MSSPTERVMAAIERLYRLWSCLVSDDVSSELYRMFAMKFDAEPAVMVTDVRKAAVECETVEELTKYVRRRLSSDCLEFSEQFSDTIDAGSGTAASYPLLFGILVICLGFCDTVLLYSVTNGDQVIGSWVEPLDAEGNPDGAYDLFAQATHIRTGELWRDPEGPVILKLGG